MTPERKAEIRTMAACNWGVSFEDALDLLAALDAAEKENERHRRANLLRAVIHGLDPEWVADLASAGQFDAIPWRIAEQMKAALDAAVEDNEALRARLGELERVVEFHVARGLSVDAMRFVQKALATPTDGTPAAVRTEEVDG